MILLRTFEKYDTITSIWEIWHNGYLEFKHIREKTVCFVEIYITMISVKMLLTFQSERNYCAMKKDVPDIWWRVTYWKIAEWATNITTAKVKTTTLRFVKTLLTSTIKKNSKCQKPAINDNGENEDKAGMSIDAKTDVLLQTAENF